MRPPTLAKIKRSQQQERSIARDVGGRRVAGSGSQPSNKGDVRSRHLLIEAKQTKAKHYSLKLAILVKIEVEAIKARLQPALVVELCGRRYVVHTYDDWLMMGGEALPDPSSD